MTEPALPVHGYHDLVRQLVQPDRRPAGRTRIASTAVVNDAGLPDPGGWPRRASTRCRTCPTTRWLFLLGSRYCETDRLSETAWALFGQTPWLGPGAGDLRLCPQPHRVRLHGRALDQDRWEVSMKSVECAAITRISRWPLPGR